VSLVVVGVLVIVLLVPVPFLLVSAAHAHNVTITKLHTPNNIRTFFLIATPPIKLSILQE
jgi:hypothetical protein